MRLNTDVSRRKFIVSSVGATVLGASGAGASGTGVGTRRVNVGYVAGKRGAVVDLLDTVETEHAFDALTATVSDADVDRLEGLSAVRYVESDHTARSQANGSYGIDQVRADVAHANGLEGADAHVAVLDSGVDHDHPDLQANLGRGASFVDGESWKRDPLGHGTHCTGIAAARANDQGSLGVTPAVTLHALKVLDKNDYARYSDIADALEHTVDRNWDVASMSIGGPHSEFLRDACQYALGHGVLLVGAAGNNTDSVVYPAAFPEVVAVGATDENDRRADFSAAGPELELLAPGSQVYSTVPDGYSYRSGTSMATPHVAAAGGMLMANGYGNGRARKRLRATAADLGYSQDKQGSGRLDVGRALLPAFNPPTGEFGRVSTAQGSAGEWHTVSLDKRYDDPVVVMNPLSANDGEACHVRVRNVTGGSFEYRLEEWPYQDGSHAAETASFLALEAGTYVTPDGTHVEVGSMNADHTASTTSFTRRFGNAPIVLAQSQTVNGSDPIVTRAEEVLSDGFTARCKEQRHREEVLVDDVNTGVRERKKLDGEHATERIGYVACEPGTDIGLVDGVSVAAGRTRQAVTDDWHRTDFARQSERPWLLAAMQTITGEDTAGLRYRRLGRGGVDVRVEEEQSLDDETDHDREVVGYMIGVPVSTTSSDGSSDDTTDDADGSEPTQDGDTSSPDSDSDGSTPDQNGDGDTGASSPDSDSDGSEPTQDGDGDTDTSSSDSDSDGSEPSSDGSGGSSTPSSSDPNGDGRYEDVNGDGREDVVDVQRLFTTRDEVSDDGPFDFNGNGRVNVVDVQRLFSQMG
jgi:subtilisin